MVTERVTSKNIVVKDPIGVQDTKKYRDYRNETDLNRRMIQVHRRIQ